MSLIATKRHPGSEALLKKFASEEEKAAYFRDLAWRSHRVRIAVSDVELAALTSAYDLLGSIAAKARAKQVISPTEPDQDDDDSKAA